MLIRFFLNSCKDGLKEGKTERRKDGMSFFFVRCRITHVLNIPRIYKTKETKKYLPVVTLSLT